MRKVYTATSLADAHMIAHEMGANGIEATVQGEADPLEPCTVWIKDEEHERALAVIAAIDAADRPPAGAAAARREPRAMLRVTASLFVLSLALNVYLASRSPPVQRPGEWDANGDGKIDNWAQYDGDRLVQDARDTNFDGRRDDWAFYASDGSAERREVDANFDGRLDGWEWYAPGVLVRREVDADFDGAVDAWERYAGGQLESAEYDDDGDGKIDERASYRHGRPVERAWSFAGDGVVDKKAIYDRGRKVRELFDRDRDGRFDETVELDRFERVVVQR